MEFQYRAGDKRRSRSPSPPSPAPSALKASPPRDGYYHPASGADGGDVRREWEKAKIRDRIMREETMDRFELELEVRLELVERFRQRSVVLNAGGAEPPARVIVVDSSPPPVAPKVNSKVSASAASLAKRKSPAVHDAAYNASVETNSKKQNLGLTCTVCSITATAEKVMKDHLDGKNHKKKAAQPATKPEPVPDPQEADALLMAASGDFKPTKFTMVTNAGMLNDVTQMDGYLLCEVCNVRTTDRVTMMCHLEGAKHISKPHKVLGEKCVNGQAAPETADTVEGELHTVRRQGGSSLLCERCAVRAPSERSMRLHLLGKKHKTKVDSNGGMEAQENETASPQTKEASPLAKAMQENTTGGMEDTMATSVNKDVATVESSEAPGKEAATVSIGAPAAVSDSEDLVVMEVDGVRHPLRRVEGILLCLCCDVKAKSEVVMRSHLAGKKHKNKMTSTTKTAAIKVPKMEKSSGAVANLESSVTIMEAKKKAAGAAAGVVPMELDAPGEVETVMTPSEPADGITKPVTIYVDGNRATVLQQENGRMSCELCGERGIIKDDMLKHLYTRMHWEKASLAEKKAQMAQAAAVALVKDGQGSSPAADGTAEASAGELITTA